MRAVLTVSAVRATSAVLAELLILPPPPTDALQQGAAQFEQQAGALKNKMWWKNMKVRRQETSI